jgi:hypothetical protein
MRMGRVTSGQEALKKEATRHFRGFFELGEQPLLADQVYTTSLFPHFVTEEDSNLLDRPCTKLEIREVLKTLCKR